MLNSYHFSCRNKHYQQLLYEERSSIMKVLLSLASFQIRLGLYVSTDNSHEISSLILHENYDRCHNFFLYILALYGLIKLDDG